ncbi:hypothetical protein ACFOWU_17455 [Epilithonimonas zeae]|uniref:Uncharacterized protein n=1 Tax=Epilithonimonas zeae TaxID=1416779 RepID=A0A1N6JPK9_9FLAO|nr:hypothetical protein [Epilithonimonas zeae]SIO46282.1 hypothetical protein SAMN05444409_3655 [Epilithonimonas zeae]
MNKFILIVFLLIADTIFAQAGNENISFSTGNFFMRGNRPSTKEKIIDGTPYINGNDFTKVIIEGYSKNVQNLRYNAYDDEMEFKEGEDIYFTNKEEGLKIDFPALKKTYQCLNYSYDNKNRFGYLVLLVDNPKYSLFKKEKVELLKGEKSPNAYSKDANDYYAKEKDVYLIKKDNTFSKLPKNQKEFINDFSLNKTEFDKFIKDNKLNFSKEEDLKKIITYFNSL